MDLLGVLFSYQYPDRGDHQMGFLIQAVSATCQVCPDVLGVVFPLGLQKTVSFTGLGVRPGLRRLSTGGPSWGG